MASCKTAFCDFNTVDGPRWNKAGRNFQADGGMESAGASLGFAIASKTD
jgi:hypothetical protein